MALAEELVIALEQGIGQHQLIRQINPRLLDLARDGKQALRLSNKLETEKRKLLQIVMLGQPELDRKLESNEIRRLRQRIAFRYRLSPLNRDELQFYLAHRLSVAGYAGGRLFGPGAVRALHGASSGYPRLVNILGHKAWMLAYGEGRQQVGTRHVRAAARDTGSAGKQHGAWLTATALLVFAALGGAGWMVLQ